VSADLVERGRRVMRQEWEERLAAYVSTAFKATAIASGGQSAIQYVNKFTTSGSGQIGFTGPTTIYATGAVTVSGGALVTSSSVPDNLKIYVTSPASVTISGNGTLYAQVYANQSDVTVSGSGIVAGSIVGNTLTNSGGASLYHDLSGSSGLKVSLAR